MEELERQDIQGILLSSYSHLYWAFYVLLQVQDPDAARRGLSAIVDKVTTAEGKEEEASVNIALTQTGLTKLGLDPAALASFPIAFQEGMSSQHRSRILGDTGQSAPAAWKWGEPDKSVDILLMLFAPDQPAVEAQLQQARRLFPANGVIEIDTLAAQRYPDNKEHFGFADGIGQPVIEGSGRLKRQLERTGHATEVKAGEFILGYVNEYDVPSDSPMVDPAKDPRQVLPDSAAGSARDLGRNGTYLVFRQMTQNVAGFWQFLDGATRHSDGESDPEARDRLGAKFVGRWKSGAPLVETPDTDCPKLGNDNDFGYAQSDSHGFACPFGAHIRRANPRDCLGDDPKEALERARRHRLLRRGRSYGPRAADPFVDDGKERGLHFICLNSDIERQFEFVQQTWINNPVFDRLNGEVDPLVGDLGKGTGFLTIQGHPIRSRVHDLRPFSTIKGGAYFFLPGIRALRYLSSLES
jgi:Dyp-type peroxidase family